MGQTTESAVDVQVFGANDEVVHAGVRLQIKTEHGMASVALVLVSLHLRSARHYAFWD